MTPDNQIMREAFSVIAATIESAGKNGVLVDRDALARRLLVSHLGRRLINRSETVRRDRGKPFETAANYVDWFSAHVTQASALTAEWNERFHRARVLTESAATGKTREVWAYSVRPDNVRGKLVIRVGPGGRLGVGIIGKDGSWTDSGGLGRLPCGIYTVTFGRWASILQELEELINAPNVDERAFQAFFERNPDLLRGDRYQAVIPEAVIHRDDSAPTSAWEADFVLAPVDQESFCRVIELKRPSFGTARSEKRGHPRFYRELKEAVDQLRDYHEAFNSRQTRATFRERYGVDVFKPDLQLIIGRSWTPQERSAMLELQRRCFVEIRSWDGELARLRREFT